MKYDVVILMGSDSDLEKMRPAAQFLTEMEIPCGMFVISAHRAIDLLANAVRNWTQEGTKVFIAGAGLAAHLPGVVAGLTHRPVIGVPLEAKSALMSGLDSVMAILQMPPGVPVATVALNGSVNAAILAAQILSLENENSEKTKKIEKQIVNFRQKKGAAYDNQPRS